MLRLYSGTNGHESAADDENEAKMAGGEEGSDEDDAGAAEPTSPLLDGPPPVTNVLRTPQLSDFGLSELFLKKGLARSEWCPEEPSMPQISLPQPFKAAGPPPMPVTPKCALWLNDDEPQTPKLHEFAISEPTLCLLNDFTMDLFKKNVQKPQRCLFFSFLWLMLLQKSIFTATKQFLESFQQLYLCILFQMMSFLER